MKTRNAIVGILGAFAMIAPGCGSSKDETSDETHFQACQTNGDCSDARLELTCQGGYCKSWNAVDARAGSGGAPSDVPDSSADGGTGNVPCDDGSRTFCKNGIGGMGGAVALIGCPEYQAAGLSDVECSSAEGAAAKEALLSWCGHVGSVGDGLLRQGVDMCGTSRIVSDTSHPLQLDPAAICDPNLPGNLRSCADALAPCERLPLCAADGIFGCEQILARCPAVSASRCRAGFDSHTFEGRTRIHECITTAPSTEDCVATFYRCVWGL